MKLSRKVRSERALSPSRGCAPGWSEAPSAAASALRPPSTNCNSSHEFHGVHNCAGLCSECGTCRVPATLAGQRHPDLLPAPSRPPSANCSSPMTDRCATFHAHAKPDAAWRSSSLH